MLFEFTDVVNSGKLKKSDWYELRHDISSGIIPSAAMVCAIGYPGFRNSIDYEAKNYAKSPNVVWGKETRPRMQGRLSLVPDPEISFDPAGMSGGPVFGFRLESHSPEVFLAGIIANASNAVFNFMPLTRIRRAIEQFIDRS